MATDPAFRTAPALIAAVSLAVCAGSLSYVLEPREIISFKGGLAALSGEIFEKSAAKKFSGAIAELKTLAGPEPDKYLEESLLPELRVLLLDKKSPYTSIIEPAEYEARIRALRADLQARGVPAGVIAETVLNKTRKAKKTPDYNAELSWTWADRDNGCLQVVFRVSAVDLIEAKTLITHPAYEQRYLGRKHYFTVLSALSGAAAAVCLAALAWAALVFKLSAAGAYAALPALKIKIEEFANAGQFQAACNEIDKHLACLPDNSDLLALKNKLLVKTRGRPANAEKAYNKLRFIGGKLESRGMDKLDLKDLEDLRLVAEALEVENLGVIIGRVEGQLHPRLAGARVTAARSRAKALLDNGLPAEAARELEKAQQDPALDEYAGLLANMDANARLLLPAPDSLKSLHGAAEDIVRKSLADLAQARELLNRGEAARAGDLLEKAFKANRELAGAGELLAKLEKSRNAERLVLTPEKIGRKIFIFRKDFITAFRRDLKEPDIEINAGAVSRDAHLKIAVTGNKVLAEDQHSSAGTKIGGQQLKGGTKLEINDGDILDFAGAYRMTAHLCRGGAGAAPTRTGGATASPAPRPEPAGSGNIGAVFLEGEDDRSFIMLLESAPVSFKATGLAYEKSGDCAICVKNGAVLLLTPDHAEILCPGARIEYKGIRYRS